MKIIQLLLIFTLVLPSMASAHAWLKLRIATTEYAPYTSSKMEHNGYINHIISNAFLETGVIVEYTTLPWDEALKATLAGEYDALSYGNFVRSREDQFWHSEPISVDNLVFYVNKKTGPKTWNSLNDIKGYKMGITKGYLLTDELAEYMEGSDNIKKYKDDLATLNALIDGDIDILPIDELTGWYLLQREFNASERDAVELIHPSLSTSTTHLLVSKNAAKGRLILELFNEGLSRLKLEGKMERFERLLKEGYYQYPEKPVNYDRR